MICAPTRSACSRSKAGPQMSMLPRLRPREFLRPRHRSRDRPAGADPGEHGSSLSAAARIGERRSDPTRQRGASCKTSCTRRWACRCFRSRRCASPWWRPVSPRPRRTSCGGRWRRGKQRRHDRQFFTEDRQRHGRATATRASFAERCFSQIRVSANTDFPKATRRASRMLVYVVARGSNATTRPSFCARAAEQPADGVLRAGADRARCAEHGVEVRAVGCE